MKEYVDYVYEIVKAELDFFEALYEDHIINIVGHAGLTELRSHGLLEGCGAVANRQLYVLIDKNEEVKCSWKKRFGKMLLDQKPYR